MDEPPELPLPPDEGEGMLGEVRPPEPPEEPLEPLAPPDEPLGGDGMELEDDCCCGQPPMRNAQTAPIAVTCAATTGRDLRER
jgi:hypothetical protein